MILDTHADQDVLIGPCPRPPSLQNLTSRYADFDDFHPILDPTFDLLLTL